MIHLPVSAWQGHLLGCLPLEKVRVVAGGGCSVVRWGHDEWTDIAARLVSHFGLSGVGDIDLRIDHRSGAPCLLEINPRVVPPVHLGQRFGRDLLSPLRDALEGRSVTREVQEERAASSLQVALFPFEWMRDPASPHLWADLHDVPWDDPRLLSEMTRRFAPGPQNPRDPDADLFDAINGAPRSSTGKP